MYQPREDSYFLSEFLKEYFKKIKKNLNKKITILDMGTGSAIQAETCAKFIKKKNILCSDINSQAVKQARKKGFKTIRSNLFSNIKERFDLIIFNPPYLSQDKYDKEKDTTGGGLGDETILNFLNQLPKHLNKNGKAFLLLSSLTPKNRIEKLLKKLKLKKKKLAEKKLFFETLEIWVILISDI